MIESNHLTLWAKAENKIDPYSLLPLRLVEFLADRSEVGDPHRAMLPT